MYEHLNDDHDLALFIHSFFYMSIIILGAKDMTVNKTDKYSYLQQAYLLMQEIADK